MLALLALTAVAATLARRAVSELSVVSEATVWNFADVTLGASYTSDFKLEGDAKNVENIYANFEDVTYASTFKADALAFTGEYPIRSNSKKFAQSGTLHFKTSVAGKIVVKFNDTGSSASATAVKRYLVVNGTQTEYWTSRENNGTEDPYAAQLNVTTGEIEVPAGDVTIAGSSAICVSYIKFTPNSTEPESNANQSYTLTFKDAGTDSDSPSDLSSEGSIDVSSILGADEAAYVSSVTNATKVYLGRTGRGLKLGTGSVTGTFTLNLATPVKPTSIVVKARKYNNNQNTIKINGNDFTLNDETSDDCTVQYDGNTEVSSIAIEAGNLRAYVLSVTVNYQEAGGEEPQPVADIIYDFAAAATAGENPDNWNYGSAFYGWENEGKTYSKRQDYKGYSNYSGTNLPAECHVFRRSDRINGNIAEGGLKCPNQREMAINGLTAGSKVVIEYTGEGQMLYATGYDPANATAEPNTVAIVGDGNKAAISGTTAIPSGTPIHIVSTDNGYFVFRVLKNMVITKITISEETPIDPATVVKPNKVTVATGIENGTVKVSQAQAFAGDEVTVTATPADGYELEAITVKDADGADVTVTDGKFTMPAKAVTVSATFKPAPVDVEIAAADIAEGKLTDAIVAKAADKPIKNLTVTLAENTDYTVTAPIEVAGNVNINGAVGAKIDASALTAPFIKMAEISANAPLNDKGAYVIDGITIKDVTITGLPYQLIYGNKQKYLMSKILVENSVIGINGTAKKTIFDFNGGGNASEIIVNNSTLWANPSNEQNGGLFSSQSGHGSIQDLGSDKQLFAITNSTIYNIAYGRTTNSQRRNNTAGMEYKVENSIIVNSGKNGQFIVGLNGGSANSAQTYTVNGNVFNFDDADVSAAEQAKVQEKIAEFAMTSINGVVAFTEAANGDFNAELSVALVPAEPTVAVGDPRWTITAKQVPVDVVISPADGDIATALTAASEGKIVKNIIINLTENVTYTVGATMVAPNSITINGNGAIIDASALEANVIEWKTKATEDTEWTNADVSISGVTVKGLKKALFFSNSKYYYGDFSLINSVVEQAGDATTFDYTKGSVAINFMVSGSTIYAPTATTKSLYSSQGGQKATEYKDDVTQSFAFLLNTMYNLAKGKNFFSHRQSNQKWMAYGVQSNLFVNCGKSGQTIKGMNGGQGGANPTWAISGNAFNFEGADTSANEATGDDEEPVKESVAGVMTFNNVETPDFGGTFEMPVGATAPTALGDIRWTITFTNAPASKFYIIGLNGNWDRTNMIEMTRNESGRYEYEFTTETQAFFAFADKQMTAEEAEADSDWSVFNSFRYSLGDGDVEYTQLGEIKSLVKGAANGTITLKPGTFKITVEPDFNAVTITGEFAPEPQPVTVDKLFIMGTGTPKGWEGTTELTFNEATQAFEYEATVTEDTYLTFGDAEFTSWADFNGKHRFAPAEGNTDAVLDQAVQLVLVNDGCVVLKNAGTYKISVTKDLKMTITAAGTGINSIAADKMKNATIYTVSGQRVEKAQKGLYIINGRKVVIK